MPKTERDAAYPDGDYRLGRLRLHVARPAAPTRVGVILYPTIMGLDDSMRSLAADFAAEGMTAVVWDPYDGVDASGTIMDMLARSKEREDNDVVRDLTEITDHLQNDLGLASIAGIGWCFGGRIGLLHAGSDARVGALAIYNPTIYSPDGFEILGTIVSRSDYPKQTLDEFALAAAIRGPVQVSRPQNDFTSPVEYQRLLDTLVARDEPTFYDYHPGASHGFSYSPGEANAKAHRYAWASTLSIFRTTLPA